MLAGPVVSGAIVTGTRIARPALLVAVLIGVTVCESPFPTYAVFPLGVIAMTPGRRPTLIGRPALFVAGVIGVTAAPSPVGTDVGLPVGVAAVAQAWRA